MDEIADGQGGELPKLAGMELDARRLPLRLPRLVVGVEDAVAEQIVQGVPEVLPLGEAPELGFKQEFQVPGIRCHHAVQVCEPSATHRSR